LPYREETTLMSAAKAIDNRSTEVLVESTEGYRLATNGQVWRVARATDDQLFDAQLYALHLEHVTANSSPPADCADRALWAADLAINRFDWKIVGS
jgi:hypothetical protein